MMKEVIGIFGLPLRIKHVLLVRIWIVGVLIMDGMKEL